MTYRTWEDWKHLSVAFFFLIMATSVIAFTINYAFTDWDEVTENLDEGVESFAELVDCEIKYKDFYYNGICSDTEEIFDFVKTQYNITNIDDIIIKTNNDVTIYTEGWDIEQ